MTPFSFIPVVHTAAVLAALSLMFSCVEKKMSLQEAKQVSVSMRQTDLTPPPRSISDILSVLDQPGSFDPELKAELKEAADAPPPETGDDAALAEFYNRRGMSAGKLGRAAQELADKRTALVHARKAGSFPPKKMSRLLRSLASAEVKLGNFRTGQDLCREGIDLFPTAAHYTLMAGTLYKMGNFSEGDRMVEDGIALCNRLAGKSGGLKALKIRSDRARLRAMQLSAKGRHKDAEPHWREVHETMDGLRGKNPSGYLMSFVHLANNLKSQGRLVEAELLVRQGLRLAVAHGGKNSTITAAMTGFFAQVLLKQGRIQDAEKMARASVDAYAAAGLDPGSTRWARAGTLLGEIRFAQSDFQGAHRLFEDVRRDMGDNQYIYNLRIRQNRNVILCRLVLGKTGEAMAAVDDFLTRLAPFYGEKHYRSAEFLAMRGMAHARTGNTALAVRDFSRAMPVLLRGNDEDTDFLKKFRLSLMAEAYMDLMLSLHRSGEGKALGLRPALEIFRTCEYLNTSSVQGALGASGARSAARDPELADLVRKEQDAAKQITALRQSLTDLAAAASPDAAAMASVNTAVDDLTRARQALMDEIDSRFPRYSEFTRPRPRGFREIQALMAPEEAMVVFYPVSDRIYIWGIPKQGPAAFGTAHIAGASLAEAVSRLRRSLAPMPGTFSDIPAFDMDLAASLYQQLFLPVKRSWDTAEDLLVVAPGSLGQIPFSVMPVSAPQTLRDQDLLFDGYRRVDWLIRRVSITRLPSASALFTLRSLPRAPADRMAFLGFGDPVFNPSQMGAPEKGAGGSAPLRGVPLRVRGIRKVEKPKAAEPVSVTLKDLGRLPDTAEEIRSIAAVMGGEGASEIFLGPEASEARVKRTDLSRARVVAFASHGLVPGDLDGLIQPAIALSSPEITGDRSEDGLLQMGEILGLDLNADWVILSACNTGAAGGAGAEAVSGLGQAFFYAGSRALLVTMWSVESTSARKLTTGLFAHQMSDPSLTRARALQAAILDLMDRDALEYEGKKVAAYAHPFFWAPFIVVGDGS